MKLDRSSTLYATVLLTITGLLGQILGFFYRIALSRLIGAETMGLYQLIMPVYSVLLSVASIGLTTTVSNLTAEYHALRRHPSICRTLRRCLCVFSLIVLPVGTLVILFSDPISVYLLGDARTRLGIILLIPCLFLTGVENLHKHTFYGSGNVRPAAFTELSEQIIRAAAVLSLLLFFLPCSPERTVGLIVTGMVICEVFSAVTLVLLFRRHMGKHRTGEGSPASWKRISSIALPVGFTALLGNLMGSITSVLIPQRLVVGGMDPSQAMSAFGVLSGMTIPLLNMPAALISAMCLVMVPKLAESTALNDRRSLHRRLDRALCVTSVLMMPATALLTVIGPTLGRLLFGDPRVGNYMFPLAIGLLICCYQTVLGCALNGVGKQGAAARNALISDAVQVILTWCTVSLPSVGLKGYVAGFLISAAAGMLLNLISLSKATGLTLQLSNWLLAPGLSSLLMGLCANLLFHWMSHMEVPALLSVSICIIFGLIEYLAAMQAQGVSLQTLLRIN